MAEKHTTLKQLRNAMLRSKAEMLDLLVSALEEFDDDLLPDNEVSHTIFDSEGEPILDDTGAEIEGRFVYGDMGRSVYDPNGKQADIYAYADQAATGAKEYANILAEIVLRQAAAYADAAIRQAYARFYDNLLIDHAIHHTIFDSNGNPVLDSSDEEVAGKLIIEIQ